MIALLFSVMFPDPLKLTPAIVLALARIVAVAALPVHDPDEPDVLPVTLPVTAPTKLVAVNAPELELKVKLLPDLVARSPVAAVVNNGKQVVSDDSSATVTLDAAVAVAAFPEHAADVPELVM